MEVISEVTPLMNSANNVNTTSNYYTDSNYAWKALKGSLNTLVHTLIGVNVFVNLCFAFNTFPPSPFQLHIGLCVIGYQLLISHGILALANYNGWSVSLTHEHRRCSHWVLQLVGSVLAAVGSIIMMKQKTVNFTSIHGKLAKKELTAKVAALKEKQCCVLYGENQVAEVFAYAALAAFIFTGVSLLNGVLSLYRVGVLRVITAKANKIIHLALGTVAFALSSVCLVYGLLKKSFKEWSSAEFSYLMIAITCVYTVIIISRPCYIVGQKLYRLAKYKTC